MRTLLGANGAGKTTVLRALCGMVRTDGEIRFDGQAGSRAGRPRTSCGSASRTCPRGAARFTTLTVEENLQLGAMTRRDRAGIAADIERVYGHFPRLRERRAQQAGTLSGGEQQMLAVGRALMLRPRLMLLDEPSFGLAPLIVEELFAILRRVNREIGVAMLIVEQNAALALDTGRTRLPARNRPHRDGRPGRRDRRRRIDPPRVSGVLTMRIDRGSRRRPPAACRQDAGAPRRTAMELLLQQVLAGLATGAIYACMALAVVMIYQAIDHLNFAQGEMAMFSTFIAWQLHPMGPALLGRVRRRGRVVVCRRRVDRAGAVPAAPQRAGPEPDRRVHRAVQHPEQPRRLDLGLQHQEVSDAVRQRAAVRRAA